MSHTALLLLLLPLLAVGVVVVAPAAPAAAAAAATACAAAAAACCCCSCSCRAAAAERAVPPPALPRAWGAGEHLAAMPMKLASMSPGDVPSSDSLQCCARAVEAALYLRSSSLLAQKQFTCAAAAAAPPPTRRAPKTALHGTRAAGSGRAMQQDSATRLKCERHRHITAARHSSLPHALCCPSDLLT